GGRKGSLLGGLAAPRRPRGGRLLRRFLGQPLLDLDAIGARQDAVAAFVERRLLRGELLTALGSIGDLDRLTSRTLQGVATARDLLALRELLGALEPPRERLAGLAAPPAGHGALGPGPGGAEENSRAAAPAA